MSFLRVNGEGTATSRPATKIDADFTAHLRLRYGRIDKVGNESYDGQCSKDNFVSHHDIIWILGRSPESIARAVAELRGASSLHEPK